MDYWYAIVSPVAKSTEKTSKPRCSPPALPQPWRTSLQRRLSDVLMGLNTMKRIYMLIFFLIVPVLMSAQTSSRDDSQVELEKLASLVKQGAVGKVRVLHVHDSMLTRVAVSKDALHSIATSTQDFSDQIAEKFGSLLSGVSVKTDNHTPDLRWGVFFYDPQGQVIGSLFVDKFGQYGYLNGQTVSFEMGTFARSLAKRLHKITGIPN